MKIEAVLFDLGETLIKLGKVDTVALLENGARCSYDFLKQSGQNVGGFQRYYLRNIFAIRVMYAWSCICGRDFDALGVFRAIGLRRGYKLSQQQWQQFAWCWCEPLSRLATVEPDIRQTLSKLRDAGLKLGIVSNTFLTRSSHDRHLEHFGMLEFFPIRMYSQETPWRKPNVKIFDEAARQIGVEPQNIIFVGDRINQDIKGAKKAGMIPILKSAYTNESKETPQGIRKINLLSELPPLISPAEQARARVEVARELAGMPQPATLTLTPATAERNLPPTAPQSR